MWAGWRRNEQGSTKDPCFSSTVPPISPSKTMSQVGPPAGLWLFSMLRSHRRTNLRCRARAHMFTDDRVEGGLAGRRDRSDTICYLLIFSYFKDWPKYKYIKKNLLKLPSTKVYWLTQIYWKPFLLLVRLPFNVQGAEVGTEASMPTHHSLYHAVNMPRLKLSIYSQIMKICFNSTFGISRGNHDQWM